MYRFKKSRVVLVSLFFIIAGYLIPQNLIIPVKNASTADWNPKSFWYYPWGKSITHKGIDIFAKSGTPVLAPEKGIVLYSGSLSRGGNIVLMLGPKWRLHYFAHLNSINTQFFMLHSKGSLLGTVGDTGNAKGKSPHLHYSIFSPIPYYLWRIDNSKLGWMKMFFLDPGDYMEGGV